MNHELIQLFEYHHWAGDRVLAALAPVTARQLDNKWGGSFGSGRALLTHVIGVERLWLERWKGNSLRAIPDFAATADGRVFQTEWMQVKADQQAFLSQLSAERVAGELTYVNLKGLTWTYRLADVLRHVVNHGTYHRAQIVHLLRDLGLAAPSTDYLVFVDEQRAEGDR